MSHILTCVAGDTNIGLHEHHIQQIENMLTAANVKPLSEARWLKNMHAAEIKISGELFESVMENIREMLSSDHIDVFCTPADNRRKKLLLADMDSTIVEGETLDDLADFAGLKEKIATITARAMNGELDFHEAINERVGLLKGLPTDALEQTLRGLKMNKGARSLVKTMREHGAHCVLVSGGFTFFTDAVAKDLGFHAAHGNVLEIENNALSGFVIPPILDKNAKVEFLELYCDRLHISPQDVLCIGDGANDLPMLQAAGLGMGYHPKPAVAQHIHNYINYGDLDAALFAQGYSADEIKS